MTAPFSPTSLPSMINAQTDPLPVVYDFLTTLLDTSKTHFVFNMKKDHKVNTQGVIGLNYAVLPGTSPKKWFTYGKLVPSNNAFQDLVREEHGTYYDCFGDPILPSWWLTLTAEFSDMDQGQFQQLQQQ